MFSFSSGNFCFDASTTFSSENTPLRSSERSNFPFLSGSILNNTFGLSHFGFTSHSLVNSWFGAIPGENCHLLQTQTYAEFAV